MLTNELVERAVRDAKLVADAPLTEAVRAAMQRRSALVSILEERELVPVPELYRVLAAALAVPFVDLTMLRIPPATLQRIPATLASTRRVVAYEEADGILRVAMEDPDDLDTIELLRRALDIDVAPALAHPDAISQLLRRYAHEVDASIAELTTTPSLPAAPAPAMQPARAIGDLRAAAEEVSIVRIVNAMLQHALNLRASDIHIEPTEQRIDIRMRVDGELRQEMTLPRSMASAIVARIKVLARLKIDEHRLPQDGRFKLTTPTERVAFRTSIMPVQDGEKIVLRLLRESIGALTLNDLGLRADALGGVAPLAVVEHNIRKPHGIIFVTGPTGSGKTTTLYAMVTTLNEPSVNISSIEDPIEYRIPGVNQSQVQPRIGFTFAIGLRSLLRQDPNIIMVGEIRDSETADVAVNAALTGHLVLATLHTNDAATSVVRLQEMGVPTFLVASTINCVIAQRLVRQLCTECREETLLSPELLEALSAYDQAEVERALKLHAHRSESKAKTPTLKTMRVWKSVGCPACHAGYRGRIGLFEVLDVSPAITELIQTRATRDAIHEQAVDEGMATMFVDGLLKAFEGTTSIEEVLRVTRE